MDSGYLLRQHTACPQRCQGREGHSRPVRSADPHRGPGLSRARLQLLPLPPTPRRHAPRRTLLPQGCAGNLEKPQESLPLARPPLSLQDHFKSPEPVKSLVTSQSSSLTLRKPDGPQPAGGRKDSRAALPGVVAASVRESAQPHLRNKRRKKCSSQHCFS